MSQIHRIQDCSLSLLFGPGMKLPPINDPHDHGCADEFITQAAESHHAAGIPGAQAVPDEPEELLAQALYLLQLCQQDLNMGRSSTIWPRARRAAQAINELCEIFAPQTGDFQEGAK